MIAFAKSLSAQLFQLSWPHASALLLKGACVLLVSNWLAACSGSESDPGNPPASPTIVISEAATANSTFLDEDGDGSDWLELHNSSDAAVSLKGWTLSDNPDEPYLWTLPDITLAPGAYLVVWASDKDRAAPQLHANFKLSNDGEQVVLSDASGKEISRLLANGAPAGYSVGLNAAKQNGYFASPTPGKVNSTVWFSGLITGNVSFSKTGGENSQGTLTLSGAANGETIRYTLDSTIPTDRSPVYSSPISITDATVIRARIFRDGFIPSNTASRTFLPGEIHELPVVTLITDPKNFFDEETGIYIFGDTYEEEPPFFGANFWEDWEREIHLAFYESDGELGTELDAGVKIFGGWSRANDQRSLAIFARSRYGTNEIEYPLFPDLPYDEFQTLVLRNSGNDWMRTMVRDAVLTSLMEGSGLDYAAYRPTAAYLNGDYWGIYNLREKINEHLLASKHGVDADDVDLLEGNATVVEGSNTAYMALMQFVQRENLTLPANYANVESQIDIQNYITYQVAQIYFNNQDWPGNNIKFWKSPETKWRWILFDVEFSFGLYEPEEYTINALEFATATSGPTWPNPPWSTLLFRQLLTNSTFEHAFINTFADALNGRFLPERVIARIDEYAAPIESEIPRHYERWQLAVEEPRTLDNWHEDLDQMREFALQRPLYMWQHLAAYFDLADPVTITLEMNAAAGQVRLNSLLISSTEWNGLYFPGLPITLVAEAKPGYKFSHWGDNTSNTAASLVVDPAAQTRFVPVFVRTGN
jgi:hypothetical protein